MEASTDRAPSSKGFVSLSELDLSAMSSDIDQLDAMSISAMSASALSASTPPKNSKIWRTLSDPWGGRGTTPSSGKGTPSPSAPSARGVSMSSCASARDPVRRQLLPPPPPSPPPASGGERRLGSSPRATLTARMADLLGKCAVRGGLNPADLSAGGSMISANSDAPKKVKDFLRVTSRGTEPVMRDLQRELSCVAGGDASLAASSSSSSYTATRRARRASAAARAGAAQSLGVLEILHCGLCNARVGKLKRHYCRFCGRHVCGPCAQSWVQLPGQLRPARACAACAEGAQGVRASKDHLAQLAERLSSLGGDTALEPAGRKARHLAEVAELCEAAFAAPPTFPLSVLASPFEEEEGKDGQTPDTPMSRKQALARVTSVCALGALLLGPGAAGEAAARLLVRPQAPKERPPPLQLAQKLFDMMQAKKRADRAEAELRAERIARENAQAQAAIGRQQLLNIGERLRQLVGVHVSANQQRSDDMEGAAGFADDAVADLEKYLRTGAGRRGRASLRRESDDTDGVNPHPNLRGGRRVQGPLEDVAWEKDASTCFVCDDKIGKLRLNRRHHCRLCGRCVCSACSMSWVQVPPYKELQRACNNCLRGIETVPTSKARLISLAGRLWQIGTGSEPESIDIDAALCAPLDEVVARCEAAALAAEEYVRGAILATSESSSAIGLSDQRLPDAVMAMAKTSVSLSSAPDSLAAAPDAGASACSHSRYDAGSERGGGGGCPSEGGAPTNGTTLSRAGSACANRDPRSPVLSEVDLALANLELSPKGASSIATAAMFGSTASDTPATPHR